MTKRQDKPVAAPFGGSGDPHLAFRRQLAEILDQAGLAEEQRQQILIAASCPCCGAGGMSLSLPLKSGAAPGF